MSQEELFQQERINRLDNNNEAQIKVFSTLLETCQSLEDTILLLKLLAKKKNQIKLSVRWLLQTIKKKHELTVYPENLPVEHLQFFLVILRDIIEGKLFLEQERIDFVQYIKRMYVHFGHFEEALHLSYDVPIETFSTIRLEDIAIFQMEVLKLAVICQDTFRSEILARKIKKKHLNENQDLKKQLRLLKVDHFVMSGQYLSATEEILKIVNDINNQTELTGKTASLHIVNVQKDSPQAKSTKEEIEKNKNTALPKFRYFYELQNHSPLSTVLIQQACFYAIISSDQSDSLRNSSKNTDKRTELLIDLKSNKYNFEKTREIIDQFLRKDLIGKEECHKKMVCLYQEAHEDNKESKKIYSDISNTISLHNLTLISQIFSSITFSDLETLLQTPIENLLDLLTTTHLPFKIDQRNEFVHFESKNEQEVLETLKTLDESVMFVVKERLERKIMAEKLNE